MKTAAWLLLGIFVLATSSTVASSADGQAPGAYDWLNGKWTGEPPRGGLLQMVLKVEGDDQVRGQGFIHTGGRNGPHPQITGKIKGDLIRLRAFFPGAFPQSAVVYICKLTDETLQCMTPRGYETTFKKVEDRRASPS